VIRIIIEGLESETTQAVAAITDAMPRVGFRVMLESRPGGPTGPRFAASLCVVTKPLAEGERCARCGQVEQGQTGEFPCEDCGLPTMWDGGTPIPRSIPFATSVSRRPSVAPADPNDLPNQPDTKEQT
jgi:hypothetical protein